MWKFFWIFLLFCSNILPILVHSAPELSLKTFDIWNDNNDNDLVDMEEDRSHEVQHLEMIRSRKKYERGLWVNFTSVLYFFVSLYMLNNKILFAVLHLFPVPVDGECLSADGRRIGACFNAYECRNKGGKASGDCAMGFGVCCICEFSSNFRKV